MLSIQRIWVQSCCWWGSQNAWLNVRVYLRRMFSSYCFDSYLFFYIYKYFDSSSCVTGGTTLSWDNIPVEVWCSYRLGSGFEHWFSWSECFEFIFVFRSRIEHCFFELIRLKIVLEARYFGGGFYSSLLAIVSLGVCKNLNPTSFDIVVFGFREHIDMALSFFSGAKRHI